MAINIQQPQQQVVGQQGKRGGSQMGQIIGTVAGAALGASGGLGGASAGAALGGQLGGMAGGMAKPEQPNTLAAVQRRVDAVGQTTQAPDYSSQLQQSIAALKSTNDPNLIKEYAPPLAQALIKSYGGGNGGVA